MRDGEENESWENECTGRESKGEMEQGLQEKKGVYVVILQGETKEMEERKTI